MLQYAAACIWYRSRYVGARNAPEHTRDQGSRAIRYVAVNVGVCCSRSPYVVVCCALFFSLCTNPKSILWCLHSTWAHSRLSCSCSQVCCSACCSMLQFVSVCVWHRNLYFGVRNPPEPTRECGAREVRCVAVCGSMSQYFAVCCSMLQCVYDTELDRSLLAFHFSTRETMVLGYGVSMISRLPKNMGLFCRIQSLS